MTHTIANACCCIIQEYIGEYFEQDVGVPVPVALLSHILENSTFLEILQGFHGSYLLGDGGYALTHYTMTPVCNPRINRNVVSIQRMHMHEE